MSMTDTDKGGLPIVQTATVDYADYFAQDAARRKLADDLRPANKAALFEALAAAGIATVAVNFDGCGDSGQIESIDAQDAAGEAQALPTLSVDLAFPSCDGSNIDHQSILAREAIEELAYGLLEDTHSGWEINEGAYGEFTFDVAKRSIRLDYNERVETSVYSEHEW